MKGAPRPWTASGTIVFDADGFEIVDTSDGPHLHRDYNSNIGHWAMHAGMERERSEEDEETLAALFAIAPEMLEALEAIEPFLPRLDAGPVRHSAHAQAAGKIRAAIEKARGR